MSRKRMLRYCLLDLAQTGRVVWYALCREGIRSAYQTLLDNLGWWWYAYPANPAFVDDWRSS